MFQRRFLLAQTQRPVQQQSFGFGHRPDGRLNRVAAELLQRGDALVPVDYQIAFRVVFGNDHDDGRLLAAVGQRRQQPALPVRLADPQMLPSPVQLVKFQLHRRVA